MVGRTLPLLVRSLRVDARQVRTHLLRLFFIGFIGLNLFYAQMLSSVFGAPGLQFFATMMFLNFAFITLAGIAFATGITEEKEEDTLGLLKMAGIGPLVILLGKSTSRLLTALMLLLIQIPFTLLAITLGGVMMQQVVAAYCTLAAYMVLLANLGLLCSVVSRRSSGACGLMVLSLLGFFIGPHIGNGLLAVWAYRSESPAVAAVSEAGTAAFNKLIEASVLGRLTAIMTTGFNESLVTLQFVSSLVAAVVFFGLAWLVFEPCTRNLAASTAPGRILLPTNISLLRGLRGGRVWNNALAWKDFNFVVGGRMVTFLKFTLYGAAAAAAWFVPYYFFKYPQSRAEIGAVIGWSSLVIVLIEAALYSSRIFHEEVKWKTLPAVMMLPKSMPRLVGAKVAGCLLGLAPAFAYLVLGCFLSLEGILTFILETLRQSRDEMVLVTLGLLATWALYYVAFLHLTAFLSLVVRWGALPLAFLLMLMLSWCWMMGMSLITMMAIGLLAGANTSLGFLPVFVITNAAIVGGIVLLQVGICARLRTVAAQ